MPTSQRILASPFLPSIPAIAADDLGRVVFPGTTRAGRGKLALPDRDPHNPAKTITTDGPSSYTRSATDTREGGQYPPRVIGRPAKSFR
jgi:hypothetical protein